MFDTVIRYTVSVLPVITFLVFLIFLDSYKLLRFSSVSTAVIFGVGAALTSFLIGGAILANGGLSHDAYARYAAPPIEESLKLLYMAYLIRTKRVGFMVDAAIFGFAIGTGFAVLENLYVLHHIQTAIVLIWIIRGFGTAVMHGGTVALAGIGAVSLIERRVASPMRALLPGFALAVLIHSAYNHFFLAPPLSALAVVIVLPLLMAAVFRESEKGLKKWLGIGFDSDAQLMEMISTGTITETPIGQYLFSLESRFPGPALADMLCLLRLHVELALKAKGVLLMREAGFEVKPDPELKEKFEEMRYLEKSIGRTGLFAMDPILHWNSRDLWQLYMLGKR